MMSDDHIRERAYHLWEAGGRQEGRKQEYWDRAQALIDEEGKTQPAVGG
jgi:hypothetical protein